MKRETGQLLKLETIQTHLQDAGNSHNVKRQGQVGEQLHSWAQASIQSWKRRNYGKTIHSKSKDNENGKEIQNSP